MALRTLRTISAPCICGFLLLTLGGCIAAGAGAAAGAAVSSGPPSEEAKKYVRTHELEPRIARAIEGGYLVAGMTPQQVEFLRGEPDRTESKNGRTIWIYDPSDINEVRLAFRDGELVEAPNVME
jgi:hypothetical protein